MVRDDERGVIGLEFGKKKYKNYFLFELSRATSRADPNSNYRARLARAKLARVILARARLARARAEPRTRTFLCSPTR
jgi:hypothetical protein